MPNASDRKLLSIATLPDGTAIIEYRLKCSLYGNEYSTVPLGYYLAKLQGNPVLSVMSDGYFNTLCASHWR